MEITKGLQHGLRRKFKFIFEGINNFELTKSLKRIKNKDSIICLHNSVRLFLEIHAQR